MHMSVLLGIAAALFAAVPAGALQLEILVDDATAAFTVAVGGAAWLKSLPPTASCWGSSAGAGRALQLLRRTTSSGAHPTLGPYNETRFFWAAPSSWGSPTATGSGAAVPVETAFLQFEGDGTDGQTFLLEQTFPEGLARCNRTDTKAGLMELSRPVLSFPNFVRGGREGELGALTWASTFSQLAWQKLLGDMPNNVLGRQNGGPVVVFDERAGYNALVISPFDHFLAATTWVNPKYRSSSSSNKSNGGGGGGGGIARATLHGAAANGGWWQHGISAEIQSLPAGFMHSTILRTGNGITDALQRWGTKMRTAKQTRRNPDIALSHLSYWTDNGAYYYMYGARNALCDTLAHGRMDHVLLQLIDSWKSMQLPVRSIQLDDWWYVGTGDASEDSHDHMCVKELSPKKELFPDGLPPLPEQISYHLYGPFFCEDNVYAHNFPFANSTANNGREADPMPGASEAFYTHLFRSERAKGVRMTNYEVDFLQDQTTWFEPFVTEVDGSARWLKGMATAAASLNMSVQYCMSHPAAFLEALSFPAVTNGRASGDYVAPTGNLLAYGTAAPFFAAAQVAPSKDNWWSMPNQPLPRRLSSGPPPCDGGARNVTDNFLHGVSILSQTFLLLNFVLNLCVRSLQRSSLC
jgi:hypothetical protein